MPAKKGRRNLPAQQQQQTHTDIRTHAYCIPWIHIEYESESISNDNCAFSKVAIDPELCMKLNTACVSVLFSVSVVELHMFDPNLLRLPVVVRFGVVQPALSADAEATPVLGLLLLLGGCLELLVSLFESALNFSV